MSSPSTRLSRHPWSFSWLKIKIVTLLMKFIAGSLLSLDSFVKKLRLPADPDLKVTYMEIPSREKGRMIRSYVYTPTNVPAGKKLPLHINWHGSGFVLPMFGEDAEFCRFLSKTLNMVVIDVDYRKAPENPFPLQNQDAEDAVAFILTTSDYDLSRFSIGGHSAGGNLALATSSLFGSKVSAVACFYPKVDFTKKENQPERKQRSGIVLSPFLSYYFGSSYLVNEEDMFNPKCSPILLEASTFPKTVFVTTGNADLLFPEGKAFIQKLKEDGHQDAVFLEIDGEGHAWEKRPNCKESQEKKEEALFGYVEAIKRGWNH